MLKIERIIIVTGGCLLSAALASVAIDLSHLPQIGDLKTANPEATALMEQRAREAKRKGRAYRPYQAFVPYGAVSPHLKHALLVAEDAAFFSHSGVDFEEVKEAIKADWKRKRFARGASTITMQLAKNLYLSTSKSLTRKASEFVLAQRMDAVLSKTRIFELYLNYIEWGDGIYGCEAAARSYFGCSSSQLVPEQAIRLAAIVVNPRRYNPYSDTKRMNRRRCYIAERMYDAGYLTLEEFQALPF
jgi:monofunctional biosynthetic peptidoglycan transglycosylase